MKLGGGVLDVLLGRSSAEDEVIQALDIVAGEDPVIDLPVLLHAAGIRRSVDLGTRATAGHASGRSGRLERGRSGAHPAHGGIGSGCSRARAHNAADGPPHRSTSHPPACRPSQLRSPANLPKPNLLSHNTTSRMNCLRLCHAHGAQSPAAHYTPSQWLLGPCKSNNLSNLLSSLPVSLREEMGKNPGVLAHTLPYPNCAMEARVLEMLGLAL